MLSIDSKAKPRSDSIGRSGHALVAVLLLVGTIGLLSIAMSSI